MRVWLNIDAGELEGEPAELHRLADLLNVACGGHAGDEASMARALGAFGHGVRVGAHPSYPDREGFGRRSIAISPPELHRELAAQCARLSSVAARLGVGLGHAKLHGALYHDAARDPALAAAAVRGIEAGLGSVAVLGPAGSELERACRARGLSFLREGFADRALRPDGTLVPRSEPGALLEDPAQAAAQARRLAESGAFDTLCVHGDTAGAVAIARAVREALERA